MTLKTLVIFDLETTGIPAKDAKITEICLIAVSRNDIERADGKNLPPLDKLIFLCNPEKTIQPKAAEITGLTNLFLKNKPIFKNNIECINAFLNNQPKPACLIAHNGNVFDFKIIQAEYLRANKTLPADLACVDSLKVFRSILKEPLKIPADTMKDDSGISLDESDTGTEEVNWLELSMEEIQEMNELLDQFSNLSTTSDNKDTKGKSKIKGSKQENTKKEIKQVKPPPTQIKSPEKEKAPKTSYTLESIYKQLVNKKVMNAHRAEADCIMLLECIIAKRIEFLEFADSNHKLLTCINP